MSVKKTVFLNLSEHLMSRLNSTDADFTAGLPDLRWCDKQMGQFENAELSFAIPLPTVLLEFGPFVWTTTAGNSQKGEGTIRAYIYFENYANSFTGSLNQDLALQFFEFTEAVHKVLQAHSIKDIMSPMVRIGDAEDTAQDMIITSVMDYSCTLFDNATDRSRNFTDVEPDLEVEYKRESSRPPVDPDKSFLV